MPRSALAVILAFAVLVAGCESDGETGMDKMGADKPGFVSLNAPEPAESKPPAASAGRVAANPSTAGPVRTTSLPPLVRTGAFGNDPMALKKALQDGDAVPIALPQDMMVRLFRMPEPFQPTADGLRIIEAYARHLTGADQKRLRYELQICHTAPACVVVPLR